MYVIHETFAKVLLDEVGCAADAHIYTVCGSACLFQCGVNSVGDKVESCTALHSQWCARVMGHDEYRHVVDRILAPPASSMLVQPRSANWPEHISTENPCTDVLEASRGIVIVDPGLAAIYAKQFSLESLRGYCPAVQRLAADSERVLQTLVRASGVAVNGQREALDPKTLHWGYSLVE